MSKLSSLKAQLGRTAAPKAAVAPSPVAAAPARSTMAPSRVGKVHIGAYLSPDFKRSLMLVRATTGKTETQVIAEALNDLFRAHNVPVVDTD